MSIPAKLAVWSVLAVLGGSGYFCTRAAGHFREKAQTTLSSLTLIHCPIVCEFTAGNHNPVARDGLSSRELGDYESPDLTLRNVQVDGPAFLQARVATVSVMGFSGLAAPKVQIDLELKPDQAVAPETGSWPVMIKGMAEPSAAYWTRQLGPAREDLLRLEAAGSAQASRARQRVESLQAEAAKWSQPHLLAGSGHVEIRSISEAGGASAEWGARIFGVIGLILLALTGLIAAAYVMILKAG